MNLQNLYVTEDSECKLNKKKALDNGHCPVPQTRDCLKIKNFYTSIISSTVEKINGGNAMYPDNPGEDAYYDELADEYETGTDEKLEELKYECRAGEWD